MRFGNAWRGLALLALALLSVGCGSKAVPAVDIGGTNSLAIVGSRLFVASTTDPALRVIDLVPSTPTYLLAPNPLSVLSLPTGNSPHSIGGVTYPDGSASPLVVALSIVDRNLSVLSTGKLTHLGAIPLTGYLPLELVMLPHEPGASMPVLVVALDSSNAATLLRFDLAPSLEQNRSQIPLLTPTVVATTPALGAVTPTALAVNPGNPDELMLGDDQGIARITLSTGAVTSLAIPGGVDTLVYDTTGARLLTLAGGNQFTAYDAPTLTPLPGSPVTLPEAVTSLVLGGSAVVSYPRIVNGAVDRSVVSFASLLMVAGMSGKLYLFDGTPMTPIATNDGTTTGIAWIQSLNHTLPIAAVYSVLRTRFFVAFLGSDAVETIYETNLVSGSSGGFATP